MSDIRGYLSEGKLFIRSGDGKESEIRSKFVDELRDRLQSIKDRREWKTTGSGAQFARGGLPTGSIFEVDSFNPQFSAACVSAEPGTIYYAIAAGDVHGIFEYSPEERREQRLVHGPDRRFSWLAAHPDGEHVAVAINRQDGSGCIGIMRPARGGGVREITEGDAIDAYPAWGPGEGGRLVYQSSGIARRNGAWAGLGPASIQQLDRESGAVEPLAEDERFDYLCPGFGPDGRLYYIQRPYEAVAKTKPLDLFKDVVLFPFRLVRAVFAFLNVFSMFFSGKPLKTAGGPKRDGPDPKAVFLYGRWVNLEQSARGPQTEEPVAAVPSSWVLKRREPGAAEDTAEVLAKGVMAYTVGSDGTVYFSNGRGVFRLKSDGSREKVSALPLVTCLFAD
ncbi:MAG: hypothetical protein J0M04_09750 [Verrucomicrobia bacterium]|nr:hypothetical protein [Verrucomicrobiota bacterium]